MKYETVINNGTIIDPKRQIQTIGNIGIKDGKIAKVTRETIVGDKVIDAKDHIVCPGFVDIHSHLAHSRYLTWLSAAQGITTTLSGNCGMNDEIPIKGFLDQLEAEGYPINFATLIGHSWCLRNAVGLDDPYVAATDEQIDRMCTLAEQALAEGAVGLSFGLEYAPGTSEKEYLSLARVAAKYDKLVAIHIRTDALDFATGLNEAISIAEKTGARLQISHLAYQFGVHKDVTEMALVMIENAIKKGLPIMCDSGVYTAFATFIQSAVFADGWHERYGVDIGSLMISSGKYVGQRATEELARKIRAEETSTVGTAFVGVYKDLVLALNRPYTMLSTDAGIVKEEGEGHPQDSGTFPKVFGKLVREQGVLSMMDAVIKSTWLPAKQIGISDRKGWIGEGADADIVVFNPLTITDNSDYIGIGQPDVQPTGIHYVFVNGVAIVEESNLLKEKTPGKIIRKPNILWSM